MKVYTTSQHQARGSHTVHIAPAAHVKKDQCPESWFKPDGMPENFTVAFVHGVAEVTDEIGRYLVAHKMAGKSRLIIPEGVEA